MWWLAHGWIQSGHLLPLQPWHWSIPSACPSLRRRRRRDAAVERRPRHPMMEQYIEIKAANPDCLLFYRIGDFYEMFFDDAETASRALGIMLTKRGKHQGRDIPMCGVPVERADEYLHRLSRARPPRRVCEQLEDPAEAKKRGPKSVVRRDVIRLVTPARSPKTPCSTPNATISCWRSRAPALHRAVTTTASGWPGSTSRPVNSTSPNATRLALREIARLEQARSSSPTRCFPMRAGAAVAFAAGGDAARPRRVRRRQRRTAAHIVLRGGDQRGFRHAHAAGTDRGGGLRDLRRAHADRQTPALSPPLREAASATMAIDQATRAIWS